MSSEPTAPIPSGSSSSGHRWGKLSRGQTYGLFADDTARRLASIRLTDYERLLLNHLREYSWARSTRRKEKGRLFPDAIPYRETIDATAREIAQGKLDAKEFVYLRKKLYAAADTLHHDCILIRDDDKTFILINTNCDEWKTYTREILPAGVGIAYSLAVQNSSLDELETPPESDSPIPLQEGTRSPQKGNGPYKGTRVRRL